MFHFTTTNVINSNQDFTTGKPLWSFQEEANGRPASFNVKRVNNFKKPFVTHIYKAVPVDPEMAKVTIDLSQLNGKEGDNFNLAIVIGLSRGGSSSAYATNSGQHRRPFNVDFVFQADATKTAKALVKLINSFETFVYGDKLLKVSAEGTMVTFEATTEYQRFLTLDVQKFDAEASNGVGKYITVRGLEDLEEKEKNEEVTTSAEGFFKGKEGFGTYSFILHNLRMPTMARTGAFALNSDEAPVLGAKYTQYTLHYCVDRGILGMNAVGDQVHSITTHVFYVQEALAADFEANLAKLVDEIEEVPAKK